jgi:Cof subfamily protein (haloacid dehalogenase superfamily)
MTKIKLVISDVDGTLLTPDKTLTERSCEAVERLRAAAIRFTITSSRPPRGLAMLTDRLRLEHPVGAFNGGMIVEPDLKTVIEERTLPLGVANEVVDCLLDAGVDVWVFRGSEWFLRNADAWHVAHEQAALQFAPTVIDDLDNVLDGAVKILGVSNDLPHVARCEAELRQLVGAHASVARSQAYYVDVTHPDANKGMVVRRKAHLLGIPLEQIATIGDGPNDVLMFAISGMSIAMGNASPEVQRTARHVTTSNTDEGFANAVDRFVLGLSEPRTAA